VKITRRSAFTGTLHTREIAVTGEQLDRLARTGEPIQVVLPHLSRDDREFLLTGATPEEWAAYLGPAEDDR
jgi:hypothetical protein